MPPDGIDDRLLSRVLAEHWGLAPARLGYLPAGFGDHHWDVTDSAGRRWFVTVAALTGGWRGTGPAAGYADLRAAMDTVIALAGPAWSSPSRRCRPRTGKRWLRSMPGMP